ncbi:protein yellow [Nasonia vitripennis]|uniref:Bee-milk protein n=1 Tax=Nasonia vitripennis TaxID=7425 RepID=A0A7M7T6H1_NASVI|nr:protein yellow [Nasonia vitripennis]
MIKLLLIFCLSTSTWSAIEAQKAQFYWNYLNFTWPSEDAYNSALVDGLYIPENNIITGIKIYEDKLFLTLPRWKRGVPATLVSTPLTPVNNDRSPLLEPYPNWDMQKLDNCSAFQYVQSMEVDPLGRMWVLENGRTEFNTKQPRTNCPTRLVILDLKNGGKVLLDYPFPRDVVHIESVFANDIVVDHEDGGWAYITDTDSDFPGIIVFSLKDKTSWKVIHQSMKAKKEASKFVVNGTIFETNGPIDGIALSPVSDRGDRMLFYTPLASYEIFALPVHVIRDRQLSTTANIDQYVKRIGNKTSQTDGMVMSAMGDLYYGLLTEDSVAVWPSKSNSSFLQSQKLLIKDVETNQWPDTFAMDKEGKLWWTSNRIQRFMGGNVDMTEPNYHVISLDAGTRCYQYFEDGSAPDWPEIDN